MARRGTTEMLQAAVTLCSFVFCSAHLCMLSPTQRGSMVGINTPEAPDCGLTTPECGGRPRGTPIALKGGQNFTVTFQKNLNHWVKPDLGHFYVMWGTEPSTLMTLKTLKTLNMLKTLAVIPDRDEPSLTIYSVNVTIPLDAKPGVDFIIQTKYVTKDPKHPLEFYQCGDVIIV